MRYDAPDMWAIALQSGSNGNCIYVEADGVRLLFDAGISGKQAELRLAAAGRDIRDVNALLISHDHSDHVCAAGVYQRKFGLAMHVTPATLEACAERCSLGRMGEVRHFRSGQTLAFGAVRVRTWPTPHDGVDGSAFVVEAEGKRLGILTDLGHPSAELDRIVASLDAVILESNYDPDLLAAGPYPAWLQGRIRGPGGHLSNLEAAETLARSGQGLRWACLGHMSGDNNSPELALATHREVLGPDAPLAVATRYGPSAILEI